MLLTVPIAHWGMNETIGSVVADSTATEADAINYGASPDAGAIGGALYFDGVSDKVLAGTKASIAGLEGFTVTAWFRTTATKEQVLIQQRDQDGFNGEFVLRMEPDGTLTFVVFGDGANQFVIGTPNSFNDGGWHHVAAGRDGRRGFIYMDGSLETQSYGIVRNMDDSISIAIGTDSRENILYFEGWIDEVAVYDESLAAAEISMAAMIMVPQGEVRSPTPMFSWPKIPQAVSYNLWVEKLHGTANPVINETMSSSFFQPTQPLGFGSYRTWVRATLENGTKTIWQFQDFSINGAVDFNPIATKQMVSRPELTWNPFPGADHYDLWIDNLTTGTSQYVRLTNVSGTSWISNSDLPMGRYTAWVRAIDASGTAATWSRPMVFEIATVVVLTSPTGSGSNHQPAFTWQAVAGATSYQLWVDRTDIAVSQIINISGLSSTQYIPDSSLPSGSFRFWVRAFSGEGRPGYWSAPFDFVIV